jgi:hypothetical protein
VSELDKTQLAVLCERVDTLQQVVIDEKRRLNGNLERIDKRLAGMQVDLQQAQAAALSKPSWGVTAAIGFLLSLATGLIVYVVTH